MSEVAQVQADDNAAQSGAEHEEIVATKSAEELAKRLKEVSQEAKVNRQKFSEEKRKREDLEKLKLQEEGKFKELSEIWQRKASDHEAQSTKLKQAFAFKTLSDTVALEAQKLGCIDTESLVNLLPLDQIPIDETFNVDKESARAMIEDFRKSKPYFFQKAAPRVADINPGKPETKVGKPLDKMTAKEIEQILLDTYKKK
jgi:hypothetical protein